MSTICTSRARQATSALLLASAILTGATGPAGAATAAGTGGSAYSAHERAIREGVTHPWVVYRADGVYVVGRAGGRGALIIERSAPTVCGHG